MGTIQEETGICLVSYKNVTFVSVFFQKKNFYELKQRMNSAE